MKKYAKSFARKLVAMCVAVIMIASTFTGAFSAYAADLDAKNYYDSNLAANFMTWAETTDEQTAEALLDWADLYLSDLLIGLLGTDEIHFYKKILTIEINLNIYLDSVDGIIDAIAQAKGLLDSYGGLIGGDVNNINLSPLPALSKTSAADKVVSKCGVSYRANNSAKTIIMALAQTIYINSNDNNGNKNVIGQIFKGGFSYGSILNSALGGDVYALLKDKVFNASLGLQLWDGYQSDLVYNIVAELIFHKTKWYTDAEVTTFENSLKNGGTAWNFDDQLISKLVTELMQQINAEITYPTNLSHELGSEFKDTSRTRYQELREYIRVNGGTMQAAAAALNALPENQKIGKYYDPNLVYTDDGNVRLFQYGNDKLTFDKNTTLLKIGYDALSLAWKTALEPTIGIVHVNYDVDRGHGANFDNTFYYWMRENGRWNSSNWKANYTEANVRAWANASYAEYGAADADEFLGYVRNTFEYDRSVVDDPQYNWQDINSNTLFNKLRYNPLADLYFDMQTGPINLYFMETGAPKISKFFNQDFSNYTDLVSIVNDVLVAAVEDFFPQSDNIGLGDGNNNVITNLNMPALTKTNNTNNIPATLVSNALKVFEYAANVTDENILNPFYHANNKTTKSGNLLETNFEEAMIPLLIACIQNIEFANMIHDEKWNSCKDAEGVAYVALEEYLSYVLPNKNYEQLITKDGNGKLVVELHDVEVMARDAVGYLLSSIVPCRKSNGQEWNVYASDPVSDTTTIYEILNSVVCYYGGMDTYADDNTTGKGVATLLGVVNSNGSCGISINKTLWQNLDAIANKLPLLRRVITGSETAQISTEDLIYNKIIKGILDIGPNHGVTTILEQFMTILTSAPLQKGIVKMIYDDLLADSINALLGQRAGIGYATLIPKSSYYDSDSSDKTKSSTPFDSLVHSDTLALYSGGDSNKNGIIGILLSNIYEFFGGTNRNATLAKGTWTGAMFAVKAVNNFIPSFVPQLSEHKFKAATASIPNASQTGVTSGARLATTNVEFKNNSIGLNRFWRAQNGQVNRDQRYFINITDVTYTDGGGNVPNNFNLGTYSTAPIAPGDSVKIGLNGTYAPGTQLITFTIKYNVFLAEGNPTTAPTSAQCLYQDQTAVCYLYLSTESSWKDTFFNAATDNGVLYNNNNLLSQHTSLTNQAGGLSLNLYNTYIMSSADPSSVNDTGLAVTGSGRINALYSYIASDANPAFITDGEMADATSTRGQIVNYYGGATELAYANFDPNTGNLLNINKQDIRFPDESSDWDDTGYTENEINAMVEQRTTTDGNGNTVYPKVEVRTHIAYTLQDAIDNEIVRAVEKSETKFANIYVDPSAIANGEVSAATQINGLNLVDLSGTNNSGTVWYRWLKHDGSTSVKAQTVHMNIAAITGSGTTSGTTEFVISNDAEATTLQNNYNKALKEMAPYVAVDFADYDDVTDPNFPESATYNNLQGAFQDVVKAISQPVTIDNAASLASTYENVVNTQTVDYELGDLAYVPMSTSTTLTSYMSGAKARNGYYYLDAEYKVPLYSNTLLTDADVTNGKDAVGQKVAKGDDGKYYLVNDIAYKYDWDTRTYGGRNGAPYYGKTNTPATTEDGDPLYDRVQYEYHTADGQQVSSGDDWMYKFAITHSQIKANDTNDYRGFYQKKMDALNYWTQEAKKNINTEIASEIGVGISEDRYGMINVDYEVASYEKMVRIAKVGENLISTEEIKDDNGEVISKTYTTSASSMEINEALRVYNIYKDRVMKRNYEGRAINNEILCASGVAYNRITPTLATDDADATVKIASAVANNVRFGKVNAAGYLVNEGDVVYTAKSWKAYIEALAYAAKIANEQTAMISETYGAKKELQIAENNLTIDNSFTISGVVKAATNASGSATNGTAIAGAQLYSDGELVGTTDGNGAFVATVQKGTNELIVKGAGIVERTVVVATEDPTAGVSINVVIGDYNKDGKINTIDALLMSADDYSAGEASAFKAVFGQKIAYATQTIH